MDAFVSTDEPSGKPQRQSVPSHEAAQSGEAPSRAEQNLSANTPLEGEPAAPGTGPPLSQSEVDLAADARNWLKSLQETLQNIQIDWQKYDPTQIDWQNIDWLALIETYRLETGLFIAALIAISYVNWWRFLLVPLRLVTLPLRLLWAPFKWLKWPQRRNKRKNKAKPEIPPSAAKVEISALWQPEFKRLIGRDDTLAWLDAALATETTNLCLLTGPEGSGKTAVLSAWLKQLSTRQHGGAERVFGWTFPPPNRAMPAPRQADGTPLPHTATDAFFTTALSWFGYDPARYGPIGPGEDRGEKLAFMVRQSRTILLLDGLENFQNEAGEIIDPSLKIFLTTIAEFNPGLCVITSRRALSGLGPVQFGPEFHRRQLDDLAEEEARTLLGMEQVSGKESAYRGAFKSFGTRPLTLVLLAKFLRFWHRGALEEYKVIGHDTTLPWSKSLERNQARTERDAAAQAGLHPVLRILAAHAKNLAQNQETKEPETRPDLCLLYLLGLSQSPLDKATLLYLVRDKPSKRTAKKGVLTRLFSRNDSYAEALHPLINLKAPEWPKLVARLWAMGLLHPVAAKPRRGHPFAPNSVAQDRLEAPAIVRDYFGGLFKSRHPDAWQEGHRKLFAHYNSHGLPKGLPISLIHEHLPALMQIANLPKERHAEAVQTVFADNKLSALKLALVQALHQLFPNDLPQMAPLIKAIFHGIEAGLAEQALKQLYEPRIRRGDANHLVNHLKAGETDRILLAQFFDQPWQIPSKALKVDDQLKLLQWAADTLRDLGYLAAADQALGAEQKLALKRKDWRETTRSALELAKLRLAYGNLEEALEKARETIRLAEQKQDYLYQMGGLAVLGDSLHQSGRAEEAEEAFREAEEIQKTHDFLLGPLPTFLRFVYCDLLLAQGRTAEVMYKITEALDWREQSAQAATAQELALDEMILGQAYWVAAALDQEAGDLDEARNLLTSAIGGFQSGGDPGLRARSYLIRAKFLVSQEEYVTAADDIEVAHDLAKSHNLRLILADCHIETAQILLAIGDPHNKASFEIDAAAQIIEETGYHRRKPELEALYISLTNET